MNFVVVSIIAIVVILLFILIYLLTSKSEGNKSNQKTKMAGTSNTLKPINIDEIRFPKNIEKMSINALTQACRVILDSYRALNYANKLPSAMDKIEWHTWQVSILLYFYKTNNKLSLYNRDKYFHLVILELDKEHRNHEVQRVLKKYWNNANIEKDRDTLSKDVIWTARDVSIILYEISKEK